MWIITLFLGVIVGYVMCAILSIGETEGESFWENLYLMEKDSHAGTKKLLDEQLLKKDGVI